MLWRDRGTGLRSRVIILDRASAAMRERHRRLSLLTCTAWFSGVECICRARDHRCHRLAKNNLACSAARVSKPCVLNAKLPTAPENHWIQRAKRDVHEIPSSVPMTNSADLSTMNTASEADANPPCRTEKARRRWPAGFFGFSCTETGFRRFRLFSRTILLRCGTSAATANLRPSSSVPSSG